MADETKDKRVGALWYPADATPEAIAIACRGLQRRSGYTGRSTKNRRTMMQCGRQMMTRLVVIGLLSLALTACLTTQSAADNMVDDALAQAKLESDASREEAVEEARAEVRDAAAVAIGELQLEVTNLQLQVTQLEDRAQAAEGETNRLATANTTLESELNDHRDTLSLLEERIDTSLPIEHLQDYLYMDEEEIRALIKVPWPIERVSVVKGNVEGPRECILYGSTPMDSEGYIWNDLGEDHGEFVSVTNVGDDDAQHVSLRVKAPCGWPLSEVKNVSVHFLLAGVLKAWANRFVD